MRRTTLTSPYSSGPRILAPPTNQKITAFQNGTSLCINGQLIPIPQLQETVQQATPTPMPLQETSQQAIPLKASTPQPLFVLVVKKRNLYMENKVFIDIENYDVYEVVCFYNNERGATLAYTYYEPINSKGWRILSKHLKKVPYNSNTNLDTCESILEYTF